MGWPWSNLVPYCFWEVKVKGQGHQRSKCVFRLMVITQRILVRLTPNKKYKVQLVKDFRSRSRSRSFKVKVKFTFLTIFPQISTVLTPNINHKICLNELNKIGSRSRSRKVTQGQGQICIFDHISANIDHINFKQKTLALCQWTATRKVKVTGQGHPRSPKVKVKSTFLAIFQWILTVLTPNKSH